MRAAETSHWLHIKQYRGKRLGFDAFIAVVLPCYRVRKHIVDVITKIGLEVSRIYVVDDCCPEESGAYVLDACSDPRVKVIFNTQNQGVGGAVMAGYKAAIEDGADIIVKIDGDGQMDPALIPDFVAPIISGEADYTKGNRFYNLESVKAMPRMRLFGNSVLSFMTKFSSGYWDIFDPTNGYTAIHAEVARQLPFDQISRRYFFETDMLFRLNIQRAVVIDIPMIAKYEDEISNLKISRIVGEFAFKHARNSLKRIFYNYYLRDLSVASIELPLGIVLFLFGIFFGAYHWISSALSGSATTAGTVMLAALPTLMGLQLLLAFISHDVNSVPQRAIHVTRRSMNKTAVALRRRRENDHR
jgi:glycosyltransferase involved in cell wall biosynthesis